MVDDKTTKHCRALHNKRNIYLFNLSNLPKGYRPKWGQQTGVYKANVPSIKLKRQSLHAFLIKTRFFKSLLIWEQYYLARSKDKDSRNVNSLWYDRCNNTDIYSNNYLLTLEGWQTGWVSMTEKSRQRALFLFTTWLEKSKSLSNKTFFFLSFNAAFAEN